MAEEPKLPEELSPNRYIEKVSLVTGEVLDEEIDPEKLLVHSHRDYHVVDFQARRFLSRVVAVTGDDRLARKRMQEVRRFGHKAASLVAKAIGHEEPARVAQALFGLKRREYYFRYKKHPLSAAEIEERLGRLRAEARERLAQAATEGSLGIRALLTGGTGFVGQEVLWQAAYDDDIAEMVVLIRPKRDRATRKVQSPEERGETLLDRLWLTDPKMRAKFRFVAGDVEEPNLGVSQEDFDELKGRLTHVIHSAASVSFDDPYLDSFRANVTGTLNALRFSHALQSAPGSPFVAHVGIETSYIHGRKMRVKAREDEIVFPRNFYNNFYELTKAMASLETERFMLGEGLRVVQLCPAIVIGESRAGNNRGDTKVVNAPVNVFGRAHQALSSSKGGWVDRSKGAVLARMACIFPGNPSAEINLIPVDWVVAGILAAVKRPEAVGERVHLATDKRLTSEEMQTIVHEELGVRIRLAEPTLHRNVTLPMISKLLNRLNQGRLANGLEKLGTIFGGYSEWGQPIHEVGKDVEVLGLPEKRPDTQRAFRMLCRHNRFVQDFGQIRDPEEISRREKVWWEFITALEERTGRPAGAIPPQVFRRTVSKRIDLEAFVLKDKESPARRQTGGKGKPDGRRKAAARVRRSRRKTRS